MPAATYIAKTSENVDAAKDFLAFVASVEGTEAMTAAVAPAGPYVIKGATLPATSLPAVKDIQAYLDDGAAVPALEFLSPVKGPSLEQITVAVGSGLNTAEEAPPCTTRTSRSRRSSSAFPAGSELGVALG